MNDTTSEASPNEPPTSHDPQQGAGVSVPVEAAATAFASEHAPTYPPPHKTVRLSAPRVPKDDTVVAVLCVLPLSQYNATGLSSCKPRLVQEMAFRPSPAFSHHLSLVESDWDKEQGNREAGYELEPIDKRSSITTRLLEDSGPMKVKRATTILVATPLRFRTTARRKRLPKSSLPVIRGKARRAPRLVETDKELLNKPNDSLRSDQSTPSEATNAVPGRLLP